MINYSTFFIANFLIDIQNYFDTSNQDKHLICNPLLPKPTGDAGRASWSRNAQTAWVQIPSALQFFQNQSMKNSTRKVCKKDQNCGSIVKNDCGSGLEERWLDSNAEETEEDLGTLFK